MRAADIPPHSPPPRNPLLDAASHLLRQIHPSSSKEDSNAPPVNPIPLIKQFKIHCQDLGYNRLKIADACFFLCALLDQHAISTKPLLPLFFKKTSEADTGFMNRLQRRQKQPEQNIDLIELAYLCLSLGFHPQADQHPSESERMQLIDTLYQDIRHIRGDPARLVSTLTTQNQDRKIKRWQRLVGRMPGWLSVLLASSVLLSVALFYHIQLEQQTRPLLKQIEHASQDSMPAH